MQLGCLPVIKFYVSGGNFLSLDDSEASSVNYEVIIMCTK